MGGWQDKLRIRPNTFSLSLLPGNGLNRLVYFTFTTGETWPMCNDPPAMGTGEEMEKAADAVSANFFQLC